MNHRSWRPWSPALLTLLSLSAMACGKGGRVSPDAAPGEQCGNGTVDRGEECDDGNIVGGDGCSAACALEPAGCGDGIRYEEGGEECDDGNTLDGDGCSSACRHETGPDCGNGHRDSDEECDDGNTVDGDGCSSSCQTEGPSPNCGNGTLDPSDGEECDDGSANSDTIADACRTDCTFAHCGDGVADSGEECDDGSANNDDSPNTCRTNCMAARCGDGVKDADEDCDDGNDTDTDACTNSCHAATCGDGVLENGAEACDDGNDNSDSAPDACRTDCAPARCGDNVTDTGEACDDGNASDMDACLNDCTAAICGDGVVHTGMEACDDGTNNSDSAPDACRTDCTTPRCGDAVTDSGEGCDDGNDSDADGCLTDCTLPTCGDGTVQTGEQCDDGTDNSNTQPDACRENCTDHRCQDGVTDSDEECDDGNADSTDDCLASCVAASCGDGFVHATAEECDNGPANSDSAPDACRTDCSTPRCGDGVTDSGETCDDGNLVSGDGCDANCTPTGCGNRVITSPESCDDGNMVSGDGCSNTCREEFCGDGMLNNGGIEQCDDGNTLPNDCCTGGCMIESGCEIELNNNRATANDIEARGDWRMRGFVDPSGDVDYYFFDIPMSDAPADFRAETFDGPLGSLCVSNAVDSQIDLLDSAGTLIDTDDDGGEGFCSLLEVSGLAAGRYYVVVRASSLAPSATFDYTLRIDVGPVVCGDGHASAPEACDGTDFKGETCFDMGYVGGSLTCSGACDAIITDSCVPPTCGDHVAEGFEECDDGNTTPGDGCDENCAVEAIAEVEPNEDGSVSAGGDLLLGNDFATGNANGPFADSVIIRAAFGVPGDEDVFAITNTMGMAQVVTAETFAMEFPYGTCTAGTDTVINVRDEAGTVLDTDDEGGVGSCSRIDVALDPGETRYIQVLDYGDTDLADYYLSLRFRVPVCGDGVLDATEGCDDGNAQDGDGCDAGCILMPLSENEPNDDGSVAPNGDFLEGNDFSIANADGPLTADTIVLAAFGEAGDEDVYALTNSGASTAAVRLQTFDGDAYGDCTSLTAPDTVLNIRDAAGTLIDQDDDSGLGYCSDLTIAVPAGTTYYIHILDYADNDVSTYYLVADFL